MVARLWWKDARQFWPIWVLLAVIGLAAQLLVLHYDGDARKGILAVMALGWTCLYAFAVAAAAFAGERENRTLTLLDALPVERWRLWTGKVSFAFVSTLVLGILLFLAAELASDRWLVMTEWWWEYVPPWRAILTGSTVLLAVLGCSFFWSAVMSNALLAGVLGVCTALTVVPALDAGLHLKMDDEDLRLNELVLGGLTLIASGFLFVRSGPPRRPLVQRRIQPLTAPPAAAPVEVATKVPRQPRFWPAAARSLAWQTFRDLRSIWWRLAVLCLVLPACLYVGMRPPREPGFWMLCVLAANIMAGVSVFGVENRAKTHVFLANEGVQPGLVWLIKTSIWLAAMFVLGVLTFLVCTFFGGVPRISLPPRDEALFILVTICGVWLITLAIPILCGMVIRRGITAGMVALLVLLLVLPPLFGLLAMRMLPSVFLLLVPLAFLLVSFAWSRDWMLDRPGARRWVKLAVVLAACFGAVFAAYVAVRVEGVPTLDPVREAQIFQFTTPASVSAADNAADLYRQAASSISPMPIGVSQMIWGGMNVKAEDAQAWYRDNARGLELIRKAAAMPACQFTPLDKLTMFSASYNANSDMALIRTIPALLGVSVLDHQARGDLDGAWNDLVVMFRIARQWSGAVPVSHVFSGLACEGGALSRAMVWAADAKQTPERLRSALDAYRKLPPMPNPADPIRAEAQVLRNTEKLPRAELVEKILDLRTQGRDRYGLGTDELWVDTETTPWELARTSRAFRLLLASKIEAAQVDPWYAGTRVRWRGEPTNRALNTGTPGQTLDSATLLEIEASTPLVQTVLPPIDSYLDYLDRIEVERRALVQILALRIWQLRHDGRLPEKLQELVTAGVLTELPADPYTPGHHFGYVRSSGQELLPLGEVGPIGTGFEELKRLRPTPGSWLLYSVGPDRRDDRATTNETNTGSGDLIFPLAESTGGKGGAPH